MRFFIDNNLSTQLADGMKAFGEDVVHLREFFDQAEDDPVWLEHIGREGWILVTRDERVRYNPSESDAIKQHNVGAFFLGGKNRSRCDLIQQLVRNWPEMKRTAARERRPFAFRIRPSGGKLDKLKVG